MISGNKTSTKVSTPACLGQSFAPER